MDEHSNHRKRMKTRFLKDGIDNFAEHEVIEMLLFFGIARKDTNLIAHNLINRFGSLRAVLDADYDQLLTVDGIGENCAILIKFASAMARRYVMSDYGKIKTYTTLDVVGQYLVTLFAGASTEIVYALYFNGKMELLDTCKICEGSVASVACSSRKIVESALKLGASGLILAHNHPSGLPAPSSSDIELTSQLEFICRNIDLTLIEHVVVAGNVYVPIMRANHLKSKGEFDCFKKY